MRETKMSSIRIAKVWKERGYNTIKKDNRIYLYFNQEYLGSCNIDDQTQWDTTDAINRDWSKRKSQ